MVIECSVGIGLELIEKGGLNLNQAKWIWKMNENKQNTWMCFVKDFLYDKMPQKAVAKIAVDSKYWLYINGKMVVFEGGLKRGQTPKSTYYDDVDLQGYFVKGENRIAILVWYFGKNGFSHVSSGMGGLHFEAIIDEIKIVSDESWKVRKNEAYIQSISDEIGPNFRLSESDIYYDASLDIGPWFLNTYSVETWNNADVLKGQECFGTLVRREIPLFRNYGIRDFINSDSVKGMYMEDTVIEMRLPYNLQFTPCLTLYAPEGKKISIRAENYYTNAPGEYGIKSVYITKNGMQEYESFGWLNGERIQFEIQAGITIINLQYRETGYETDQTGKFMCNDEFLNKLWKKCYRTLYISMRDTFMDCPDRERTQWWGDVNIEMQMLLYCMDERAAALYEKGVNSLIGWYNATGKMLTVVPSGREQFELPFQNLAGIYGFYIYYVHTGKLELIQNVYEMSRNYVLQYIIGESGLVEHRAGSWDWTDWGEHADVVILENSWYYLALDSCMKMAKALGISEDIVEYAERLQTIQKSIPKKVNGQGLFYDYTDNQEPDDRANAVAVLAGLADVSNYEALAKLFHKVENASPYMEKYVLDALCEMGRIDDAIARLKRRFYVMVEDEYTTLWELWNKEASLNHAWSGGALITLSKYIAGISVDEEGGEKYKIRPHLGTLEWVECEVPTKYGILKVQIMKEEKKYTINVRYPKGIDIIVEPELYDKMKIEIIVQENDDTFVKKVAKGGDKANE